MAFYNPMGDYWKGLYGMTEYERAIEPAVAALGIPYRTQFPCFLFGMGKWFPDFLLPTIGVVLEVDDDSHEEDEKKAADALRTAALEKLGYIVVRCTNDEAVNNPFGTVNRLINHPDILSRKGPGIPPCQFREKAKKKKNGNPTRSARPTLARSPSPQGRGDDQEVPKQGGRLPRASGR